MTAPTALAALISLAALPPVADDPFGPRWYPAANVAGVERGEDAVLVDCRRDVLAFEARPEADLGELSIVAEAALVAVVAERIHKDPSSVAAHVSLAGPARRMTADGLVAVELSAALDEEGLRSFAARLAASPDVVRIHTVLGRSYGRAFVDDRLVLSAAPGRLDEAIGVALAKLGGRMVRRSRLPDTALLEVGAEAAHDAVLASQMLATLGHGAIRVAQPQLYRELRLLSDDPLFDDQWHLSRETVTGVPGTAHIDAPGAWEITEGTPSVVVAVFDSGIELTHPDLAANVVGGFDRIDDDGDPSPGCSTDGNGTEPSDLCPSNAPFRDAHGTAVAGVAVAAGNNQSGGSGVCPACSLYAVRFIGTPTVASLTNAETFVAAVDDGAWVINNSWGPGPSVFFPVSAAIEDAFAYARTEGRDGLGTVIVFAAGNETVDVNLHPYAAHHETIAVAASSNLDDFAIYSNYGRTIDLAAPSRGGVVDEDAYGLVTADLVGVDGYAEGDSQDSFGGTSGASPVVAGVAGLVLAADPSLTADQVRLAMTSTADKIRADKIDWLALLGQDLEEVLDYDERGHSIGFGFGRVNARAAVEAALEMGLLGAACTADSEGCECNARGRCETPCETQADCPDGATCVDDACRLPFPTPGTIGQPCSSLCGTCVTAADTDFALVSICSRSCDDDSGCPAGFDCRVVNETGMAVCAVGDREAGDPFASFNCRNDFYGSRIVSAGTDGQLYCSDVCYDDAVGSCPYGFHCGSASCECVVQGNFGCRLVECNENVFGNSNWPTPMCFPNQDFGVFCNTDLDCAEGDYCGPQNACRVDDRGGCTVCQGCTTNEECGPHSLCFFDEEDAPGTCTRSCQADEDCPGDSVCRLVELQFGDITLCGPPSSDIPEDSVCGEVGFACEVACRDDVPCPHGETCADGACVPAQFTLGEVVYNPWPPPLHEPEPDTDPAVCSCTTTEEPGGAAHLAGGLALVAALVAARRRKRPSPAR